MLLLLLWLVPTAAVFSFPGQVFEKPKRRIRVPNEGG